MKRIFIVLLLWVYPLFIFGSINECLTDVYFGNGILTDEGNATANTILLKRAIQKDIFKLEYSEYKKHIGKVKEAYNSTHGMPMDLAESLNQILNATFGKPTLFSSLMRHLLDALVSWSHDADLKLQVEKYQNSIRDGHKVLVVAHSQGNLFAHDAYVELGEKSKNGWMQQYMGAVSIASPAYYDIMPGTERIDWDNDLVARLANAGSDFESDASDITCDARHVSWDDRHPGVTTPEPQDDYTTKEYVNKMYGHRWKAEPPAIEVNSLVHSFRFYMGEPLENDGHEVINPFTDSNIVDTSAKTPIMNAIQTQLDKLEKVDSQYQIVNKLGCLCKEKYVKMKHKEDANLTINIQKHKVKDFAGDDKGKIYPVEGKYVRAKCGGEKIEEIEENDACLALLDIEDGRLGTITGAQKAKSIQTRQGVIDMTLNWDHECDIDMDLYMSGSQYAIQDVKDIPNYGKEHIYIPTRYQIFPGDHYVFSANGKKAKGSNLKEEQLEDDPVQIRALLTTPAGPYFGIWEAKDFGQLDLGKFAEVDVKEKIVSQYKGGRSHVEEEAPPHVRVYDQCSDSQKKNSCGCVPCEYIVSGLKKRVENGPIAGADVTIIKASEADLPDPNILYHGKTTDDADIFKSGFIEIPQEQLDTFDDDTYYIVRAKGGDDIDRDDDMHRDITPTDNNGTIHAIIKGSDLKNLPYRVNILTEAAYQVAGGSLGDHYDSNKLSETLDTLSRKLLKKKLYPGDDENSINYHDVLLWTPAVDKKALYKPFEIYVEPIIDKLYADKERYDESYHLIYDEYNSNAPELAPLSIAIPSGLPNGTTIAHITTYNGKPFESIEIAGSYKDHFAMDRQGNLKIAKTDLIMLGNQYNLRMSAKDTTGVYGGYVSLKIRVTSELNLTDPGASMPVLSSARTYTIEENAPKGTLAAHVVFADTNSSIVAYHMDGEDADAFVIDPNGNVTVAQGADIDYERSREYHISVVATNGAGNDSYPVSLSIPISNVPDTPLFDLVVFEHVLENTPVGTEISRIRMDRTGSGEIERFEILSPNIPFEIDSNGTLRVADYLDFEQKRKYDFYAVAQTRYGSSNKIEIHIAIDDQEPERGLPVLQGAEVNIDENISGGTVIARLHLDAGASPVKKIALYGDYEKFGIDENGIFFLKDDAKLDYETKNYYRLGARALNDGGWSDEVYIVLHVNNIPDTPPTLKPAAFTIAENVPDGTVVGHVSISDPGEGILTGFTLGGSGSGDFRIDANGTIHVAGAIDYERRASYSLHVTAQSTAGESQPAAVRINVLNVPERAPILRDMNISISENTVAGSEVEHVSVIDSGDTPIVSYVLNRTDLFAIDNDGAITLLQDLNWSQIRSVDFNVTAANAYGVSEPVVIHVDILRIHYNGTDSVDMFNGTQRDEYFDAKEGNDRIIAGDGNDRLIGGKGDDYLAGGSGDDVYVYHLGDGNDTVEDSAGDDTLYLYAIDKNETLFIFDSSDLVLKFDDNATIRIVNWIDDTYKIEHFIFEDGEVESSMFDMPVVKPDAAVADLSKLGNASAAQVVQGWIMPLENGNLKVDHWIFNFEGGELIIDTLSELNSNGQAYIDIDGDGEQLGIDLWIYLYKRNSNGNWQHIANDDDSSQTYNDGSTHPYDSYLKLNLEAGEYMLGVGNFSLSSNAALNGENSAGSYGRGGAYQITFNNELEFVEIPANANGDLYGSDHFNYYVLRNDIDPFNGNGLYIENPQIVDTNGSIVNTKGHTESYGNFISFYPDDAFNDLNGSQEVNIVYDVVNQNQNRCKSLLSIQVIPSLYEKQHPEVNSILWEIIQSDDGCKMDLNTQIPK